MEHEERAERPLGGTAARGLGLLRRRNGVAPCRALCDSAALPPNHQGEFRVGGNHRNSRDALHVEHTAILASLSKTVHESLVPFVQYFRTSLLFCPRPQTTRKIAGAAFLENNRLTALD